MKYESMRVVMGSSSIKAFVAAPKALKVLGIVRLGLEFGLLAQDGAGSYLRVNGSRIETLNGAEVRRAIAFALETGRGPTLPEIHPTPPATKPVVAIRKRRHVPAALVGIPGQLAA
jgi:hypothetical protein